MSITCFVYEKFLQLPRTVSNSVWITIRCINKCIMITQKWISLLQRASNAVDEKSHNAELIFCKKNGLRAVLLSCFSLVRENKLPVIHGTQLRHLYVADRRNPALHCKRVMAGHREANDFVVHHLRSKFSLREDLQTMKHSHHHLLQFGHAVLWNAALGFQLRQICICLLLLAQESSKHVSSLYYYDLPRCATFDRFAAGSSNEPPPSYIAVEPPESRMLCNQSATSPRCALPSDCQACCISLR